MTHAYKRWRSIFHFSFFALTMMSTNNGNSRKRPLESDDNTTNKENNGISSSRATQAQDLKRRQIQQASWGLKEALTECGVLEFAPTTSDETTNDNTNNDNRIDIGCQLDASSTPSTLRSSLNALLEEMARNGIDPSNERVLADLAEIISSSNSDDSRMTLRKMLLPLYRVRTSDNLNCFSQFTQPEEMLDGSGGENEIIVESSSLIKILLRVDVLQSTLLTALVQKLPELAAAAASSDDEYNNNNNYYDDVPRLIFSNIRWLDHIVDSAALTMTFVECLTVLASSSSSCERTRQILLDAISTLPDILNDYNALVTSNDNDNGEEGQSSILATLQHLRVEDPSLLIPCLDAVGSLPLTDSQLEDVTRDALEALANVERWALPALTTFLMNNCPQQQGSSDLADEAIDAIRKLPLGKENYDDDYAMMDTSPNGGGRNDSEAVMIESLSRGFAHRSDLTSALLKAIKETKPGNHLPADIWLLACVATANHHKAKVKSIIRSKANNGGFTSQLLRQSLSGNGTALTSLFSTSLCEMADGLLRSSDSAACELGVTLYEILFQEFKDSMQRSDVISSLVTHICSGVGVKEAEVDAAMRVFSCIIDKGDDDGARALRSFNPLLLGMLEFLHQMTTSQVRRLFLLLFAAGGDKNDEMSGGLGDLNGVGGACDDIQIVIEKNLSHGQIANKRIGIIGTVAYAVTRSAELLARNCMEEEQTDATCMPAAASSPIVKDITEKIEKAYLKCQPAVANSSLDTNMTESNVIATSNSSGSAAAFLLDELCYAVKGGRLVNEIREWLDEKYQVEFEDMFVGDFEEMEGVGQKGSKGAKDDGLDPQQMPTDPQDLAILNGTSSFGLPGEFRFNMQDTESHVYVKILPILLSLGGNNREMLIQQLCPMFRLMAALSDERFGGGGLSEIDAMLECPLLMPSADTSGIDFEDLSATKQWVVTSSYFFATCWMRELVNNFIFAADPITPEATSTISSSSQGFDCIEIQKKLVGRLRALIDLEEELRFTSSQCFVFSPPGLDLLPAPKELYEVYSPNVDIPEYDPHASRAQKKAAAAEKKKLVKRAKEKEKSKSKMLKAKKKHEELLSTRALGALRPLDPQVCCALGFDELSACPGGAEGSQCLSQVQVTTCGGPVVTLLLNLLDKSLSDILSEKKSCAFNSGNGETSDDNPYHAVSHSTTSNAASAAFISSEESSKMCFALLQSYLNSGVFASLQEHLAIVAELRCGQNSSDNDEETEKHLVATARRLFSCTRTLFESEILTRSPSGKFYLGLILKQLGSGDRSGYHDSVRRPTTAKMNSLLNYVADNVSEIITGAYTGDLEFAMDGVLTMQSIYECSKRISDDSSDAKASTMNFGKRLSDVSHKLLKEHWPEETKMNKSNVGKLLTLFLEHSPDRMSSLTTTVDDVLLELPHTEKCKGPVTNYPTCSSSSFGSYYTVVISYLWKELVSLFDCDTKNPAVAKKMFDKMAELINFLQSLFDLTRENECLAKRAILLQQLKFGSKFIETFVAKAIPFFQVHFEQHKDTIFELIRRMQKNCRQMYFIIAHGKRVKDANLAKEGPRAKKSLELFIHKVKSLLKKNRCMTAMWTKALTAKDIDGSSLSDEEGTTQSDDSDAGSNDDDEEEEEEEVHVKDEEEEEEEDESESDDDED